MNAIRESEQLSDTLALSHALMLPKAYVGMGSGTGLIDAAPFGCNEGVHQGMIERNYFFSMPCNKAFQALNHQVAIHGGGVMAIIDKHYLFTGSLITSFPLMLPLRLIWQRLASSSRPSPNAKAMSLMCCGLNSGMRYAAKYLTGLMQTRRVLSTTALPAVMSYVETYLAPELTKVIHGF